MDEQTPAPDAPSYLVRTSLRNTTSLYIAADVIGIASGVVAPSENVYRAIGGGLGLVAQGVGFAFGQEGDTPLKRRFSGLSFYQEIPWEWRPETNPVRYVFGLNAGYAALYAVHNFVNGQPDAGVSNTVFTVASLAVAFPRDENAKLRNVFEVAAKAIEDNAPRIMTCTASYALLSGILHKDPYMTAQGVMWVLAALNMKFMRPREYEIRDRPPSVLP